MTTFPDLLVSGRERLLNLVLMVDPNKTLNSGASGNRKSSSTLANEIKESLNKIKSLAVTPDGGQVDYQQIPNDPLYQSYSELVRDLIDFDYKSLNGKDQQLAFWINLYNSLVIDGVIQGKVQNSVTESWLGILGFFQKASYRINDQRFSLTDIEHGVLRGNQGFPYIPGPHFASLDPRIESIITDFDPRIHFALNCASNSCPPIGVYTPENIQDQLDLAARSFINNDLKVDQDGNQISVSKIFQWYLADFGGEKALVEFLKQYLLDGESRKWIIENQSTLKVKFHSYDWGLNKASP